MMEHLNDEASKANLIEKLLRGDDEQANRAKKHMKRFSEVESKDIADEELDNPDMDIKFDKAYLKMSERMSQTESQFLLSDKEKKRLNDERQV
jgi:hypothetical protein